LSTHEQFDITVIGAGPSGLSCAIEGVRAGLNVVVFDQGSVVDAIRRFPTNLVWFSTPELLEIGDVPFVIPTLRPTRVDTIRYYQKVASHFGLDIRTFEAVTGVRKVGSLFDISTSRGELYRSRTAVVATGYFDHPNRLTVPGEELSHVAHHYDEPFKYYGANVLVVGGRNSAVEAALDLYRNGARVTLVHRGSRLSEGVKYWILPDIENRFKAGQITDLLGFTVKQIDTREVLLRGPEGDLSVPADFVFVLIGYSPDTKRLVDFGIDIEPSTLAPRHNPETFETNVTGLYVAGSVAAGRDNNKIFVENGRLHGPNIVRAILAGFGRKY
jgi:thioredoxin reductase (NADPH)